MRKNKPFALILALLMVFSVVLGACDNTEDEGNVSAGGAKANLEAMLAKFPDRAQNDNASIDGGVMKYALVSPSAFKGLFDLLLYEDANDSTILGFMTESFLSTDENLMYSQKGICTYEYDIEAKTVTLTQKHDVKWHDGEPATLDDLLFAYEVVCHPDYDGVRYNHQYMNVVGAEEYHAGTADTITGITLSDDEKTLTIQFKEFYPSILIAGFNTSGMPRHYYAGIEVKDLKASPQVRQNPIGFGPFKFNAMVPGESVDLVRFDDYWQGKPKLAGVTVEVIDGTMVPTAMEEGRFDVAAFSTQQYNDYKDPTNYTYLSSVSRGYSYTGFRFGTWDKEQNVVVPDTSMRMHDLALRQAIAYAIDNEKLGNEMYNGLRFAATTIISPFHPGYIDWDVEGYMYNPEKAKEILDAAGYKDVDGDGLREDKEGNKMTLIWASMEGEGAETMAAFKMQCWKDVGLNVELYNGRLTEFNAFYDMLQYDTDEKTVDMYDGAWSVGYDPNPASTWGPNAIFNMTRYRSDSLDAILNDIASEKAWDNEWLSERYSAWQQAFYEEVPAVPTLWRVDLTAVNNRVKNYSLERLDGTGQVSLGSYWLWELTSDTIAAK